MLEKAMLFVSKVAAGISAAVVMLMMALTVIDVFLRYLFSKPIIWNFDLQTLLIIGVVFLGISYVQSQRRHIRIDLLSSRLSLTKQLWLQLFSDIVFIFFTALVTWQMSLQAWNAWLIGDYLEGIVRISLWPAKGVLALGTGLLSLHLILHIFQDIRDLLQSKQTEGASSGWYTGLAITIVVWVLLFWGTIIIRNMTIEPATIGVISIILLLLLLLGGMPIAAASGIISIWGVFLLAGDRAGLAMAASKPFQFVLSYIMTVVPLFVAMGILAGLAGFATNAYEAARRWLQAIPGGLAHATIAGGAMFAAASGTSTAACATFAKMVLPEMFKHGVQKSLALGAVACSATLAIMIPPSIMLVTYALLTMQSVGRLLIAGVFPGLIEAALYMIMVFLRCKFNPSLIPKGASFSWKERFSSLSRAWGILFIVIVVMGGIYTGVFTPIEAGAIGAFTAFLAVAISKKISVNSISEALLDTVTLTSSVIFIIIGGMMFGCLLAQSRLPVLLTEYIASLNLSPLLILIAIMVFYLIIGCFMDALSILVITMPIVYPTILALGFDPIWFGILITFSVEVALVTPPYGLNLFVLQATVPDIKLGDLYRGVIWFVLMDIIRLVILIAFPQVALWLPGKMWG
jgi:C4-dicarboxylate transporter DctM subunit